MSIEHLVQKLNDSLPKLDERVLRLGLGLLRDLLAQFLEPDWKKRTEITETKKVTIFFLTIEKAISRNPRETQQATKQFDCKEAISSKINGPKPMTSFSEILE